MPGMIHPFIKPCKLKKGDTVGIVAPASSFDLTNFKEGIKMLRRLGYKVKYERSIFNKIWSRPGHNKQRARQINRMFADPQVKAVLCAKAGYGSSEIVSYLDPEIINNNPKIFIGYSDITILLLYIQSVSRMVVFHGPVVSGEFFKGMNPDTLDSFVRLLSDDSPFGSIKTSRLRALKGGKASGILLGGNLTLILELIEQGYTFDTDEKILFIEEIDEPDEIIDQGLKRLKNLGKLDHIKGIIFGRMTKCFEDEHQLADYLGAFFKEETFPILYNFPSGHTADIAQSHLTIPLGINVQIDADQVSVSVMEGAVE